VEFGSLNRLGAARIVLRECSPRRCSVDSHEEGAGSFSS
jgi:hypothetical protein